jgi:hypothetical protein
VSELSAFLGRHLVTTVWLVAVLVLAALAASQPW